VSKKTIPAAVEPEAVATATLDPEDVVIATSVEPAAVPVAELVAEPAATAAEPAAGVDPITAAAPTEEPVVASSADNGDVPLPVASEAASVVDDAAVAAGH
jgi:hypothetical protein